MDRSFRQIVAQRLRILRAQSGLSQEGLAEQLGTARQSVSGWESGGRVPNPEMILRIARYHGVSTDAILGAAEITVGVAG